MAVTLEQDLLEFANFIDLLRNEGVKSYLEIGSKNGGSLWMVASFLPEGSRVVSVDIGSGDYVKFLEQTVSRISTQGRDAHLILGNSADKSVIQRALALGPFDAVMIDGDHIYDAVMQDWNNYGPSARIVAFHDIAWRRADEWKEGRRIDVPRVWDELKSKYRHVEFKHCKTGKNNGIGVLWR